ncbi:MAG: DUF222 domain-containing protein [Actinomycetota bacterium]|nr:DUF222 domain-containing protein [Actinomycetota bacterium]
MVHEVVEELASVVERLCGIDPSELADGESVVALHRCLARTEAITTRASAAFDAGGAWQAEGARSPSAWLSRRCDLPSSTARRRIRLGRALRHLPAAEEAWLAGDLGEAQVAALSRTTGPHPPPPRRPWPETRRCWSAKPSACASTPSSGPCPTGANKPILTAPRTTPPVRSVDRSAAVSGEVRRRPTSPERSSPVRSDRLPTFFVVARTRS